MLDESGVYEEFRKIAPAISALPPKADMDRRGCDVRFVPKADLQEFATYVRLNSDYGTAGC